LVVAMVEKMGHNSVAPKVDSLDLLKVDLMVVAKVGQ